MVSTVEQLYDVVEVSLARGAAVLCVMAQGLTERNARAIADMAVVRRGVESSIFVPVTASRYAVGDRYEGWR